MGENLSAAKKLINEALKDAIIFEDNVTSANSS